MTVQQYSSVYITRYKRGVSATEWMLRKSTIYLTAHFITLSAFTFRAIQVAIATKQSNQLFKILYVLSFSQNIREKYKSWFFSPAAVVKSSPFGQLLVQNGPSNSIKKQTKYCGSNNEQCFCFSY
jgi:hypothetical protein